MKNVKQKIPVDVSHVRGGAHRPPYLLRVVGSLAAVGLLASSQAAWGMSRDDLAWQDQTASVLELLQADTRRALLREGGAATREASPARPVAPAEDVLRLAALYGTADQVTAVLYVNGVRKEYRPGASLPYGGAGSAREYRLQRVLDSCVVLRKARASRVRSVCFEPVAEPVPVALAHDATVLDAALPGSGPVRP